MSIYVDADACPVKEEIYRVARRYSTKVFVVSNSPLRVPQEETFEFVGVSGGFDVADDWIAERARTGDIVITADIPLAGRCLQQGARVLGPTGLEFTEDAIGDALGDPRLARHAPSVRRLPRGTLPFRQVRSLAILVEAR